MIEIVRYVDHAMLEETRMSTADIKELQVRMNCNHNDSEDKETWFDEEIPVGYTSVIDEDEFFQRYFD